MSADGQSHTHREARPLGAAAGQVVQGGGHRWSAVFTDQTGNCGAGAGLEKPDGLFTLLYSHTGHLVALILLRA